MTFRVLHFNFEKYLFLTSCEDSSTLGSFSCVEELTGELAVLCISQLSPHGIWKGCSCGETQDSRAQPIGANHGVQSNVCALQMRVTSQRQDGSRCSFHAAQSYSEEEARSQASGSSWCSPSHSPAAAVTGTLEWWAGLGQASHLPLCCCLRLYCVRRGKCP